MNVFLQTPYYGAPAWAWGVAALCILLVLVLLLRPRGRTSAMAQEYAALAATLENLQQGQERLSGGLYHVTQTHTQAQTQLLHLMEARLGDVNNKMTESLQGTARSTAHALGELQARLNTIDKAQDNITRLSGDVLSLQDILSNKQTRGAFGEIQLRDIVGKALPPDSFQWQAQLSNGTRPDCLIDLPNPPGPIVVDSKFPLESYEAMHNAETPEALNRAQTLFRQALRSHIKAIGQKYIIEGETADGALMFLPSEAVYAELHANFPEIVREGFAARVWIVSPTTCMATLHTMRAILKDARMQAQAATIRRELGLLCGDVDRLLTRVDNLDRHFGQASKDIAEIKISADKSARRAGRLDNFDFENLEEDRSPTPLLSAQTRRD